MTPLIVRHLRQALETMEGDQARLDQQIAVLRGILEDGHGSSPASARIPSPARRLMRRALRKQISARMKAYWLQRRLASQAGPKARLRKNSTPVK